MSTESIVVTVTGELDASNTHELARYVELHSFATTRLFLDLREVTFCSTTGLAMLRRLDHQYAHCDSRWWLLPSPAVRKLLRVCGAQDLPQLDTLEQTRITLPEMV